MHRTTILALAVLAPAFGSRAQTTTTATAPAIIAAPFVQFAGSEANALSLVNGIAGGTPVVLTGTNGQPTTFTPATGPIGYANASIALDLAAQQLALEGVPNPTPSQIQTVLDGGNLTVPNSATTRAETGILRMNFSGQSWTQVASALQVNYATAVGIWDSTAGQLQNSGIGLNPTQLWGSGGAQAAANAAATTGTSGGGVAGTGTTGNGPGGPAPSGAAAAVGTPLSATTGAPQTATQAQSAPMPPLTPGGYGPPNTSTGLGSRTITGSGAASGGAPAGGASGGR